MSQPHHCLLADGREKRRREETDGQGELTWMGDRIPRQCKHDLNLQMVTHPSSNRARCGHVEGDKRATTIPNHHLNRNNNIVRSDTDTANVTLHSQVTYNSLAKR